MDDVASVLRKIASESDETLARQVLSILIDDCKVVARRGATEFRWQGHGIVGERVIELLQSDEYGLNVSVDDANYIISWKEPKA